MPDSLPIRKKKINLLTPRGVRRESGLTQRHLDDLRHEGLIRPVVDGPNPLYSFEQLEEVIDVLTDRAIAMTELGSLRRRMRELRLMQSLPDQDLLLLYGIKRPRTDEGKDKEAA